MTDSVSAPAPAQSDERALPVGPVTSNLKASIKRIVLVGASVVALIVAAHLIYTYTGSQQWELVGEQNGVTVYSRKTPGVAVKQFKGVVRAQSTLVGVVAMANDPKTM